jgi:hypothetical protein
MTITDFSDRVKVSKVKDIEILFRDGNKNTYDIGGLYYGVKDAETGTIGFPQVGEEPNCIVAQIIPTTVTE